MKSSIADDQRKDLLFKRNAQAAAACANDSETPSCLRPVTRWQLRACPEQSRMGQSPLPLAFRATCRRAAPDNSVAQLCAMKRTNTVAFPLLMNQPIPRWVGEILSESLQ
jgi:hypothetical protein